MQQTRQFIWTNGALRDFKDFPPGARTEITQALTVVGEGGTPEMAKPLHGLGSGVWELALRHRGDAYRVVYALQLAKTIWIVHAFQKKSTSGIATPKHEIDLVRERIKRIKETL